MKINTLLSFALVVSGVSAFSVAPNGKNFASSASASSSSSSTTQLWDTIVSPFDNSEEADAAVGTLPDMSDKGPLDLTWDNVEMVLDDMRPYLIQDGGNVAITEIDGPVVRLELQGACGTCPSSTVRIILLLLLLLLLFILQSTTNCACSDRVTFVIFIL